MKYLPFLLVIAAALYVAYMWHADTRLAPEPKKLPKFLPKPKPVNNTTANTQTGDRRLWCPPFC